MLATDEFRFVGKETDRRWEREDDISLLNPRLVEYRWQESARLVADPVLRHKVRRYPTRVVATAAHVMPKVVKRVRRGHRIRKSTAHRIKKALAFLAKLASPNRTES